MIRELKEKFESYGLKGAKEIRAFLASALIDDIEVVEADDYTLQIDIDNPSDYARFKKAYGLFQQYYEHTVTNKPSFTPGHRHIVIKLKVPIHDIHKRIALQAALGSDCHRELLTILNIEAGHDDCIMMFEPKK